MLAKLASSSSSMWKPHASQVEIPHMMQKKRTIKFKLNRHTSNLRKYIPLSDYTIAAIRVGFEAAQEVVSLSNQTVCVWQQIMSTTVVDLGVLGGEFGFRQIL